MGDIADYYVEEMQKDAWEAREMADWYAEQEGIALLPTSKLMVGNQLKVTGAKPYKSNVPKAEKLYDNYKELVEMAEQITKYVAVVEYIGNASNSDRKRQYDFWCAFPLQENDIVVVDSANGLGLARVVGVKKSSGQANKWVVDKVDLAEHEERLRKEEKRKELEKAMEARARQVNKLARYRQMVKEDPEMAKLLRELETLEGTPLIEEGEAK